MTKKPWKDMTYLEQCQWASMETEFRIAEDGLVSQFLLTTSEVKILRAKRLKDIKATKDDIGEEIWRAIQRR